MWLKKQNITLVDTKFEFGQDKEGAIYLIDEVLTPDSSRFWPKEDYQIGISPPSFDKQYVRDWLESVNWNKSTPAPHLPEEIVTNTSAKYLEVYSRLSE